MRKIIIICTLCHMLLTRMGEIRNAYKSLALKPEDKRPLGRSRCGWEGSVKMDLKKIEFEVVTYIGTEIHFRVPLNQMDPAHTSRPISCNIHFTIFFSYLCLGLPSRLFPSGFTTDVCMHFSYSTCSEICLFLFLEVKLPHCLANHVS